MPEKIDFKKLEMCSRQTDFVAEADYLSEDVVDAARDFVEGKVSEDELNRAFAIMEAKTRDIARATAPVHIRDRYLPRVESVFMAMDKSIKEIKKLMAKGKIDDAMEVVEIDLVGQSGMLAHLRDEALVGAYIDPPGPVEKTREALPW